MYSIQSALRMISYASSVIQTLCTANRVLIAAQHEPPGEMIIYFHFKGNFKILLSGLAQRTNADYATTRMELLRVPRPSSNIVLSNKIAACTTFFIVPFFHNFHAI